MCKMLKGKEKDGRLGSLGNLNSENISYVSISHSDLYRDYMKTGSMVIHLGILAYS